MAKTNASCDCCESYSHPDHSGQINRVNRVIGQLEGVKRMIEEKRYCPDILTQTRAVCSAIRSLEAVILKCHLECCVREAFAKDEKQGDEKITELVELFKKSC